jgi:hypothetical protein
MNTKLYQYHNVFVLTDAVVEVLAGSSNILTRHNTNQF